MVRREKMDYHGCAADARRLAHAEEVLKSRFDPGRLAGFVMNLDFAAAGKLQALRRGLLDMSGAHGSQNVRGFELRKGGSSLALRDEHRVDVDGDAAEGRPRANLLDGVAIRKSSDAGFESFLREQA